MNATGLRCAACGAGHGLEPRYACAACGGVLEATYDYDRIRSRPTERPLVAVRGMDYALLPVEDRHAVRLGEGWTPLVEAPRLAAEIGIGRLWLKCEQTNPTGSFKDRSIAVGTAKALEFGFRKVVVASSGNGATAVAAYAARAGLDALLLVSEAASPEKVRQARFHGARAVRVRGSYSNCFALAAELAARFPVFNLTTTYVNPFAVEGNKTIAYELWEQLDGVVPDAVFVPVGAGPMLAGILRGYQDYQALGRVTGAPPRMVGVQADGCCPIVRAFRAGEDEVREVLQPTTLASGICDGLVGYARDGSYTLRQIRASQGMAVAVTDAEILQAQERLARGEGLFVEPTGAVGLAGLARAGREGALPASSSAVVILSGHGLKDVGMLHDLDAPLIAADWTAAAGQFGLDKE